MDYLFKSLVRLAHRQADAAFLLIDAKHPNRYSVANGDHIHRMLDEFVAQLRDMNEPVVLDADIDESAEVDDVAHRAMKLHARLQILDAQHIRVEDRSRQLFARVAARALKAVQDVAKRRNTDTERSALPARPPRVQSFAFNSPCPNASSFQPKLLAEQLIDDLIGFRMNRCTVQRIAALRNPHKADALLERFGAEPRHLLQLLAVDELAVFLAELHDILGGCCIDAGHVGEQRRRSCIHVDADMVNRRFHDAAQLSSRRFWLTSC